MKLAQDILNKNLLSFNLSVWCPHPNSLSFKTKISTRHLHGSSENNKAKNLQT